MQAIKLKINTPPPQTQQPQIQSQIPNATSKAPVLKMKVQPPVTSSSTSIATATLKTESAKPMSLKTETPKPISLKIKAPVEEYRVTAENYSKYANQRDHAYDVPDMYIGSVTMMGREERVLDLETWLFKTSDITLSHGAERLFIEIASNAGDNAARSMRKKVDPGEVVVTMSDTTIRIRNGGIPIPVEIHPVEKMYVPEMIFGTLMSGSNYGKDKVRTEAGKNGLGVKLANIFSKYLKITVADPHNEKLYTQVWENNMLVRHDPVIVPFSKTEKAFVEVEYMMDFARFGYSENKYPKEAFELYARHVLDMAFTLKIPVSFNGKKFVIKNAKDYAKLYLGKEAVKNSILYITWPEGTEVVVKKGVEFAVDKSVLPLMEICAVDTPDVEGKVAFVNGLWTRNNGVHYDAAFKAVATSVLETVNGGDKKGNKKGAEKKEKKEKKTKAQKLTLGDVKRHVSLFVNCWVENPVFDSQSKNELKAPIPKITIDEKILRPIMKWDLVNRLYAELDAKLFRSASKTDGKKRRHLNGLGKLEDANKAGTNESTNCTLYITEGDSAQTFANKLLSHIPNGKGRDYIGTYPLKGKPLNVMNAPPMQINENKEINDLKQVLGLREGVDYLLEENYDTLRYGHLMVCSDSDFDGIGHILGLVINIFHCKYPTLLKRGYVKYLRTKILEVKKRGEKIKFYTHHEYELWKQKTPDFQSWSHSYYKGLSTSTDICIKEESQNPKIVMTVYDEMAPYSMRLAFDQSLADNRKEWIRQWIPDYSVEQMAIQPISSFINHQFIQYSIENISRSLPRFTDGLKVSQRKIMWAAFKRWGAKTGNEADKMKVAQFGAYVADKTLYCHGEKSLCGAIIGMAQDFVGANNLPYFTCDGQFGSRSASGGGATSDAGDPRYLFTRPFPLMSTIFRKEDFPILSLKTEEGEKVEPVTMLPIIPMQLVNGALGVATAFSTFICSYNPLDVVYWLESKLKGIPTKQLIPWYRGFEGDITLKERKSKKDGDFDDEKIELSDDDEKEENENFIDKNTTYVVTTSGKFHEEKGKKSKIVITEIPIGRSIRKYKEFLDKLREDKIITKYDNYSTPDKPHFEVYGMENPSLKSLRLNKSYGMSNMVLLDDNDKPNKYNNTEVMLETFYSIRLGYYHKRKAYILQNIIETIATMNMKIKFILAVIKGNEMLKTRQNVTDEQANEQGAVLTIGRKKADIVIQMERCNIDIELLKKVTFHHCTEEEVQSLKDEILKIEEDRKLKEETTPEQMWLNDLEDFVKAYCKYYKCKYDPPKRLTLKVL
jgi:DNA topoisomerase-2